MKIKIAVNGILGGTVSLGILLAQSALSQNTLQFTGVSPTDEGNILLTWSSTNSELYQVQCANALNTNSDGSTAWQMLYDEYPSQGTNTFWLDTGNYNLAPAIVNPKGSSMRFYRIVDEGPDALASDEPIVSILSPTSDTAATGELTVTVVAATDQPIIAWTKLYVDGQEMLSADSVTNYAEGSTNYQMTTFDINTCEWGNEPHAIFATAESQSGYGDAVNGGPVMTGHGVSPFVPVLFSNLVTRVSFSQPSFDPSSGETQQVSAVFAANSDWTLNIVDANSNAVLTTSGSGTSMTYNWDGTGTGETNLPAGVYFYLISAETNGESYDAEIAGSSLGSDDALESSELWAVASDSDSPVPLALYPPGFDTNGFTIFSATPSEVNALYPPASPSSKSMRSSGGFSPAFSGGGSSAASQSAPAAPQRPPNNPIRGVAGVFGVAYDTYSANGTNGVGVGPLDNGLGLGMHIPMQGNAANATLTMPPLLPLKAEANNFISEMQLLGWQCGLNKADNLSIYQLEGSGTPFNQVELGVWMGHGTYGTGIDYTAGGCEQMYFPITSGGSGQYLRMSQMNLGGSGTNGLKWFAIEACNSLYQHNWSSMQSYRAYPYNSNLHLLLGTDSVDYTSPVMLQYWAQYMIVGKKSYFASGGYSPMTVQSAWYQAAEDAYQGGSYANTIVFAVAGDTACQGDSLQSYSSPQGTWTYTTQTVWQHP